MRSIRGDMITTMIKKGIRIFHPTSIPAAVVLSIALLIGFITPILNPPQASAWGCSEDDIEAREDFYARNNIASFFDPCTESACTVGGGSLTGPEPTSLKGDTNAEKVWNYMTERGLSPIAAAGVLGNMEAESGFNPFAVNPNGGAFGIVQWLGGRKTTVQQKLTDGGVPPSAYNDANNDKALLIELNHLWVEDGLPVPVPEFWEKLNAETKVEGDMSIDGSSWDSHELNEGNGSVLYFHAVVERSSNEGMDNRMSSAIAFMEAFGAGGGASGGCAIVDGGLTEDQAKILMMNYGENKDNDSVISMSDSPGTPGMGCSGGAMSNCVSFSAFFMNKFTDLKYQGGNGNQVVSGLEAAGAETGTEPRPGAIFSNGFSTSAGHTGIVLGVEGDTLIVGHASCSNPGSGRGDGTQGGGGAGFVIVGTIETGALSYSDQPRFAYPKEVNWQAVQDYINS